MEMGLMPMSTPTSQLANPAFHDSQTAREGRRRSASMCEGLVLLFSCEGESVCPDRSTSERIKRRVGFGWWRLGFVVCVWGVAALVCIRWRQGRC